MRISEIFYSVQGEGILTGVPSVFVRTTGCPLRCVWCDTPYTSWEPVGEDLTLDAIVARLTQTPGWEASRHVVITGGEPVVAPGIEELCQRLRAARLHITIETAGFVFKPLACDLASVSPKLSNSTPHQREGGRFARHHDELRQRHEPLCAWLRHTEFQLKFVIDQPADIAEVLALLALLRQGLGKDVPAERVLLMPQGVTREALAERGPWLAEICKQQGFRFCPRLHVELYGNKRGT